MQPFVCPECGHESTFDPRIAAALCPKCGYTPPADVRLGIEIAQGRPKRRGARRPSRAGELKSVQLPRKRRGAHQRFLDELLAHWQGSHTPDPDFDLPTSYRAITFFEEYQRALGEDPLQRAGSHMSYVRSYQAERRAILWFMGAYLLLRRGERAQAAQHLHDLTKLYPEFADPWIWLTATTDDPAERIDCLENAVLLEPAHPLARDALAIALGRVSPAEDPKRPESEQKTTVSNCPQCGGALHYEPGATEVECQYCGHQLALQEVNLLEEEARLVGDLRLQRRLQGHIWMDVKRIVHCQACGAELTMTHHLSKQCVFCGSTSVLVEDNDETLERPDGFLPFRLNEEGATAAIREAQRSTGQRLKSWWIGKEREVGSPQALYLPFWVFDGFVEIRSQIASRFDGYGTGKAVVSSRILTSKDRETPLRQTMMFNNLLFSAMDVPPPSLLGKVLPYELKALVPYEPRLLANWPAALYHRDVEVVIEDAYDFMLTKALWRSGPLSTVQEENIAQLRRSFQVTSATYQLLLLPVWVALAHREDRSRLVLVNGQTGKVAVSSPLRRRQK